MASRVSTPRFWIGWVISILPAGMLIFAGTVKMMKTQQVIDGFAKMGYVDKVIVPLGVAEFACALIYLVPQTAVFGAILVAAFMGGAVDASVRGGQSFLFPVAIAVLAWLGLLIREPRLGSLLPLRK